MEIVKLNGEDIELSEENLVVTEANLNLFLSEFAAKYDYFGRKHALAQKLLHQYEDKHEQVYCTKFEEYKNDGSSDKLAEARAKANEEVAKAKLALREVKYRKDLIWNYLRSMDKAHEDALNLGYNLRKELDKLSPGIMAVRAKHSIED